MKLSPFAYEFIRMVLLRYERQVFRSKYSTAYKRREIEKIKTARNEIEALNIQ